MARSRATATLVLGLVFAFALGATGALTQERVAVAGSASVLTTVTGAVLIAHARDDVVAAHEGDVLGIGDVVSTAADATAEITYVEGSSVWLEPNTRLSVTALTSEGGDGPHDAIVRVMSRAWHAVAKLISGSSRYELRTPTSTASVRG